MVSKRSSRTGLVSRTGNPSSERHKGLNWEGMEEPFSTRCAVALGLARVAADVANYCDHVEHNEEVSRDWVTVAAFDLRELALRLAKSEGLDLFSKYANRLRAIEGRNVLNSPESFDGLVASQQCHTWRDLQLVQIQHDRFFHPDVFGLQKLDQLRHYSFHLSKLAGAFARWVMNEGLDEEISNRRLPDVLLFGVKLSTVMGEKLPEERLPRSNEGYKESEGVAKESTLT